MKGDFSRSTYRPSNHYSSVRLQQGRVLLDAEWNEQADLTEHVDRITTTDVVGRTGAPKPTDPAVQNFLVTLGSNSADLLVAPGRTYVDGILCENDDPAGVLYTQQPDLPGAALPGADGNYAVYLDVWERHITGIDQHDLAFPPLLESALQGPDTATRTRIVWQVKLSQIQTLSCADFVLPGPPTGHLRAREIKVTGPLSDCSVPAWRWVSTAGEPALPGRGARRVTGQAADEVVAGQRVDRVEGEVDRHRRTDHRGCR